MSKDVDARSCRVYRSLMNNVINLSVEGNTLVGVEGTAMYLGAERIVGQSYHTLALTMTFRLFNLPTAVAPGEWPHRRDGQIDLRANPFAARLLPSELVLDLV